MYVGGVEVVELNTGGSGSVGYSFEVPAGQAWRTSAVSGSCCHGRVSREVTGLALRDTESPWMKACDSARIRGASLPLRSRERLCVTHSSFRALEVPSYKPGDFKRRA